MEAYPAWAAHLPLIRFRSKNLSSSLTVILPVFPPGGVGESKKVGLNPEGRPQPPLTSMVVFT
jgi:hypothetical protein